MTNQASPTRDEAVAEAVRVAADLERAGSRGLRVLPETAAALRLDPLCYAALREALGVKRLTAGQRRSFDEQVAAMNAEQNERTAYMRGTR